MQQKLPRRLRLVNFDNHSVKTMLSQYNLLTVNRANLSTKLNLHYIQTRFILHVHMELHKNIYDELGTRYNKDIMC